MEPQQIREKGILAKLLEKGIKILLKKECKKIDKVRVDIEASSIQIINGIIQKINIIAEEINYKNLLFDKIELEANKIKINFNISNKELEFKNEPKIKFKISLSDSSIKKILLSGNWSWIRNKITRELLNKAQFEDIKITNNQLLITASKNKENINEEEIFYLKAEKGKIYLGNKVHKKSIIVPTEDKVYVENVTIKNNLIILCANSSISF
tara:strand:- start:311 stop:943 length:633 start_codon:yes stop_codon:yes gene_type:complete